MENISVCQRKVYIVKNKDMRIRACGRVYAHTHYAHTSMRVLFNILFNFLPKTVNLSNFNLATKF